ncbi:hypothetical protein [Actinoallomurus sp. NPDC052274]
MALRCNSCGNDHVSGPCGPVKKTVVDRAKSVIRNATAPRPKPDNKGYTA